MGTASTGGTSDGATGMGTASTGDTGNGKTGNGATGSRDAGGRDSWGQGPGPARAGPARPLALSPGSGLLRAREPQGRWREPPTGSRHGSWLTEPPVPSGPAGFSPWLQHGLSPGGCSWPPGSLPGPGGRCRRGCPEVGPCSGTGTPCIALPGDSSGRAHPLPGKHQGSRAAPGSLGASAGGAAASCAGPHRCRPGMPPGHPWRRKPPWQALALGPGGTATQPQPWRRSRSLPGKDTRLKARTARGGGPGCPMALHWGHRAPRCPQTRGWALRG